MADKMTRDADSGEYLHVAKISLANKLKLEASGLPTIPFHLKIFVGWRIVSYVMKNRIVNFVSCA
jgi:hypothetical protein